MYAKLKEDRNDGVSGDYNPYYLSFFPENFDVEKRFVVKESISLFRNAFESTSKYYNNYAKENEKFNNVLIYADIDYKTIMIPIVSSNSSEFCKFIVNQIKNKSKTWGFNKHTEIVIPKFIDVKEIFTFNDYEILVSNLKKSYKVTVQ